MVEIFAAPASREFETFYFERMYPFLNLQRREHINSFLYVEDALRSLAGEWLTKLILSEKLHLNMFEIGIDYSENGKPFYSSPLVFILIFHIPQVGLCVLYPVYLWGLI